MRKKFKQVHPKRMWTHEEIEKLKSMWSNEPKDVIMKEFPHRTYGALQAMVKKLGINKDRSLVRKNKLSVLLEETNTNYYWLGLLMADGHFSKKNDIILSLSEKDKEQVYKFSEYVDATVSYKKSKIWKGYISKPIYSVAVRDVTTVPIIKSKFNIKHDKTKLACDLSPLNTKEKFLSWFAGFFDGDGCMCIRKNRKTKLFAMKMQCHSAWLENFHYIALKLKEYLGLESKVRIGARGYAEWVMYGKNQFMLIKTEVDKLNIPVMNRKWSLILECFA